jgi:ABC-type transporter Mla subunit MlaD
VPYPILPESEFNDALDSLQRLVTELSSANTAAKKLTESGEKDQIIAALNAAAGLSGNIVHCISEARDKLSSIFR